MAEYCLFYTFQDDNYIREHYRGLLNKIGLKPNDFNKWMWGKGYCKNKSNIASHLFGYNQQVNPPAREITCHLAEFFGEDSYKRVTFNNQKTHHSVWNYEIAEKAGHVTPKPVPLIENIIKHSSTEGDTVLDNCAGSGTTAIACERLNRKWIACEISEEYCKIIAKRIESERKQLKMF